MKHVCWKCISIDSAIHLLEWLKSIHNRNTGIKRKFGWKVIKYAIFTFEVRPSKVVSSFWTPNLNKLFDDFTVEVVAIRTPPAKIHYRQNWPAFCGQKRFRLVMYSLYDMKVKLRSNIGGFVGQISLNFEVLPSSVIAVVDDAAAPAFRNTHPTPIAAI